MISLDDSHQSLKQHTISCKMAEPTVRRRKKVDSVQSEYHPGTHSDVTPLDERPDHKAEHYEQHADPSELVDDTSVTPEETSVLTDFLSWINVLVGLIVMVILSYHYSQHLKQLHENEMYFSSIKEVERDISFRTESGLYYSYYKQLVHTPSISQGLYDLTHDNITEHPGTINILARMNVYQEILLAWLYNGIPTIQKAFEPVYFYIDTVFMLQGVLLSALYLITWLLSGTWVAGVLMVAFLVFNREDITRVSMTIPLRENWSLPFYWLQIVILTYYFRPDVSHQKQRLCTLGLFVTTTLFAVTWQFNQFVLILQAMALFGTQLLNLLPQHKIVTVYCMQVISMLTVCLLQFCNPMILTGLLFSFIPAALLILYIQNHYMPVCRAGLLSSIGKVIFYIVLCLLLAKVINTFLKTALNQEADDHIYRFVMSKMGLSDPRDFDVNLYLCNGAFQFISPDTFVKMSLKLVFPIYVLVHTTLLAMLVMDVFMWWGYAAQYELPDVHPAFSDQPQISYHTIQCVLNGVLSVTTLRMKYFWTPYMCVLASVGLADKQFWSWLLGYINISRSIVVNVVRHLVLLLVLSVLLWIAVPPALNELSVLREFYDPDTVELMEWIKSSTPVAAAFSGSMQLMAGVKLCTDRHITNHPHYEDKALRLKTKQLYQMYGQYEPEVISSMLRSYDSHYIILEDSICLSPRHGCRLPDLMALDQGIVPRDGEDVYKDLNLQPSNVPLFCDEVRHVTPAYSKYFRLVFSNKTFRVYEVL